MLIPARHLFLDLDGTLIDPRDGITGSIRHALSALGEPIPTPAELTRFIGPSLGRVFQELLKTDDPALIQAAVSAYREHFTSIGIFENQPYEGIPEVLASLRQLGYGLCVVTSKPRDYAVQIVDHLDLAKHFTSIYGPTLSELSSDKGTLIREALSGEGISPKTATMVGDRREDVLGAKENGLGAIGVTWGFGTPAELSDADRVVHSPLELLRWAGEDRPAVRELSVEAMRPNVHKAARIVVLDPAGSVLLVRYHDPRPIDPSKHEPQTYWVPPGGGVDEGESYERAAARELEEETGIELSAVGPQIWSRERQLMRHGELRRYQERYFLARAEPPRVLRNRTREKIEAIRWWTLNELRASTETFFPEGFVELVVPIMAGDVPAAPIDITRP